MRMIIILLLLFLVLAPAMAETSSVKAYFNGQEGTVSGVVVSRGEPFTINVTVAPDIDAYVYVMLTEPGVTWAYDRIEGDARGDAEFRICRAGDTATFNWTMAANDNWIGGTAPLNIYYQINVAGTSQIAASGYFTVVDACISPVLWEPEAGDVPAGSGSPTTTAIIALIAGAMLAAVAICRKK
jgi:sarcinarray family protein